MSRSHVTLGHTTLYMGHGQLKMEESPFFNTLSSFSKELEPEETRTYSNQKICIFQSVTGLSRCPVTLSCRLSCHAVIPRCRPSARVSRSHVTLGHTIIYMGCGELKMEELAFINTLSSVSKVLERKETRTYHILKTCPFQSVSKRCGSRQPSVA